MSCHIASDLALCCFYGEVAIYRGGRNEEMTGNSFRAFEVEARSLARTEKQGNIGARARTLDRVVDLSSHEGPSVLLLCASWTDRLTEMYFIHCGGSPGVPGHRRIFFRWRCLEKTCKTLASSFAKYKRSPPCPFRQNVSNGSWHVRRLIITRA